MKRLIAIGDVHGHLDLLDDLLNQINPSPEDQFVFLGDYIDRGPDSRGVIDGLIELQSLYTQTVFLRGNHEQMFLDALIDCLTIDGQTLAAQSRNWQGRLDRERVTNFGVFLRNGGEATLRSYGVEILQDDDFHPTRLILHGEITQRHIDFLLATQMYHQQGNYLFFHAGFDLVDPYVMLWDRSLQGPPTGKVLVIGHTPCPEYEPLISNDLIMLDTGAGHNGPLTAMDLMSGKTWQARQKK